MRLSLKVEARNLFIHVGIRAHLSTVEVQLFTPDQSCLTTALHDLFEESLKGVQTIPFSDFAQGTMVGYNLIQVIAIPAMIRRMFTISTTGVQTGCLKEHDERIENNVNGRSPMVTHSGL
jgi:hypothetical protein